MIKRIIKLVLLTLLVLLLFVVGFYFYISNTSTTDKRTLAFYKELKVELKQRGYSPSIFIFCAKRPKWYNNFLVAVSNGAAPKSRHLVGEALDIIVLDVNNDGKINAKDVDIVFSIVDKEIVKNKGGVGTYKNLNGFFSRQMVHFDCRGYKARWHK